MPKLEQLLIPSQQQTLISDLMASIFKKSFKIPKGGNQNPLIEEGQTKQRTKEKGQMNK
jgi:hypothetical protein